MKKKKDEFLNVNKEYVKQIKEKRSSGQKSNNDDTSFSGMNSRKSQSNKGDQSFSASDGDDPNNEVKYPGNGSSSSNSDSESREASGAAKGRKNKKGPSKANSKRKDVNTKELN